MGEDVIYDAEEQEQLPARGRRPRPRRVAHARLVLALAGLARSLPRRRPEHDAWRNYRRWGFESAALDLALRQAGRPLARGARPRAAAGHVRRLDRSAPPDPGRVRGCWSAPGHALQARPDEASWDEALVERARRARRAWTSSTSRRRTLARRRSDPAEPSSTGSSSRRCRHALIEDPDVCTSREGAPMPRAAPRPDHLGRADPLGRRRRRAPVPAADAELEAVAVRQSLQALLDFYDSCAERGIVALRRRPVRARPGPRADPVPGVAVPPGRAERRRAVRVQPDPVPAGLPGSPLPPAPTRSAFGGCTS